MLVSDSSVYSNNIFDQCSYVPGTVLGAGIEIYLVNTQGFRQRQSQLALCLKEINYYDLFMIALHSGFRKGGYLLN